MTKREKSETTNQDQTNQDQTTNGKISDPTPDESAAQNRQNTAFHSLPLTVHSQYLKDLSFESPAVPEIFSSLKQVPEIAIDIDVKTTPLKDDGPRSYEVTVSIVATAHFEKKVIFICEVIYAGLFTLGEVPDEIVQPVLHIECPRILFPFIRSMIGEITGNAGFPPLMINPIDFNAVYQKKSA